MPELDRLLRLYLEIERRVFIFREKYNGEDSTEEDTCLDVMDLIWYALTDEERELLNSRTADKQGNGTL